MKTFGEYIEAEESKRLNESFSLETTVEMYKRLGGDGKKPVEYPGVPGWYLQPNGIVSSCKGRQRDGDNPGEHEPIFDPYNGDFSKGYFGNVAPVPER